MQFWRTLISKHPKYAVLLIVCTLLIKALVPHGFMIGPASQTLTVRVCAESLGTRLVRKIEIPIEQGSHDPKGQHGKASGGCGFSTLGMAALGGADSKLLGLALVFILAIGFVQTVWLRASPPAFLRPPLRGPPATA